MEAQKKYEPKVRQEYKIECADLNHKNEFVQFILLKPKTDLRSRLLCRKCIEGKFNQQTNEICLISDVLEDPFNALKYTNYQGNINQIFSDFYHSYDFSFDKDAIHFKMDEIRQAILYTIVQLEKTLIEKVEIFQNTKDHFLNLENKFKQYFDTDQLKESLNEAGEKFGKITTKEKHKLQKDVNAYVEKLHSLSPQKDLNLLQQNLFNALDESKKKLAEKEQQLRLFKFKLDQGQENIIKELKNMETTFSTLNMRQSELSNTYMDELIKKINNNIQKPNDFQDKIKRIYQSKYDGLDSMKVFEKIIQLGKLDGQTLLFIFKSSSLQTFGVYVSQNLSLIFHQNKQQEFRIKDKGTPLTLNYSKSTPDILMTFGLGDIIIKSSFFGCISNLGEQFQVDPQYKIGDLKSHLANQQQFDIVEMEIFQILK